jgi:hypothetical protein
MRPKQEAVDDGEDGPRGADAQDERSENEEVGGALRQVEVWFAHACALPFGFYRSVDAAGARGILPAPSNRPTSR